MLKQLGVVSVALLLSSPTAFGQHFSYGAVAGTALTDDFNSLYVPLESISQKSGGKGVIVGPMLEWTFSKHLSVEADGLFRELRFEDALAGMHNPTVTWEFPILAKYRLFSYGRRGSSLRPFLEAGPSFRTTGNLNANPTHAGISTGGGIEFQLHRFDIAPTIRYTRWAADANANEIHARPDQIELLVAFSHSSESDRLPFGGRISVGAILGTNLLGDYPASSSTTTDPLSGFQQTFTSRSGPRSFQIGPTVEFHLTNDISLEAAAIYRPVREYSSSTFYFSGQVVTGLDKQFSCRLADASTGEV